MMSGIYRREPHPESRSAPDTAKPFPETQHAACNIAFLIEFYEKRKDLDDRYKDEKAYGIGKVVLTNNPNIFVGDTNEKT